MQLGEVVTAMPAIQKLMDASLSASIAFRIAKFAKEVEPHVTSYEKVRQELLEKFKIDNKLGPIENFITGKDLFKDIQERNPNLGSTKPVVKRRTPKVIKDTTKDPDVIKSTSTRGGRRTAAANIATERDRDTGITVDTTGVVDTSGRTDTSGRVAGDVGYVSALRQRQIDAGKIEKPETDGGDRGQNKGGLMLKKKRKTKGK